MTRINTNVASLLAQRVLNENNLNLNTSLERLSTGLRINRGKDDPAGLIASENLRAENAALSTAITNAERADQVVNIAEGGLNEISSMLTELQSLVTETANTAGLSEEERVANQLQIDSILQTIDRVASATSFQGSKLLNGNLDYSTSAVDANINTFRVNGAKLEHNGVRDVNVLVTGSAQVGGFYLSLADAQGRINLGGAGGDDGAQRTFVLEISGAEGSRELSFASGAGVSDIASAINSFTDVTGVKATVSNTGLRLESTEFGADEFVSIKVVDDGGIVNADGIYNFSAKNTAVLATAPGAPYRAWTALTNGETDKGQDVSATINGLVATTRGTTARIDTDFLNVEIDLKYDDTSPNANAARLGLVDAFTISGGGADFQLAGRVDIAGRVSLGIANVAVRELGRADVEVNDPANPTGPKLARTYTLADFTSGGDLNLIDGNLDAAQRVVDRAIRETSSLRGRLGAFQSNTVSATIRSLGIAVENSKSAESIIRDVDFAAETAELTRSQILAQSATQSLTLANNQPQAALQLLG